MLLAVCRVPETVSAAEVEALNGRMPAGFRRIGGLVCFQYDTSDVELGRAKSRLPGSARRRTNGTGTRATWAFGWSTRRRRRGTAAGWSASGACSWRGRRKPRSRGRRSRMRTNELTKIRCGECGNADAGRFHRIYVEASREKVVDGDWVVEEAWEHADGQDTYTVCEVCDSTDVEETYEKVEARVPSGVPEVTGLVAEALAHDWRLTLLEDDPERGHVAFSVSGPDSETPSDVYRLGVVQELPGSGASA